MRLLPPRPRPPREPVLPMINVVFLLLIFFLMTARLVPAPPFDMAPPESGAAPAASPLPPRVLWLGAGGALVHEGLAGEAALAALAADEGPVLIRADARLPAAELARLMRELAVLGVTELRLATEQRGAP